MIDVIMLGSGGGMPMPDRFLSSLLIKYQGRKILFDCGEGTQVALRKVNAGFKTIDIICISHVHGDHIFGLPGLLSTIANSGRSSPIIIIGPIGVTNVIQGLLSAITFLPYEVRIVENPEKSISLENTMDGLQIISFDHLKNKEIQLDFITLDHSAPCLGYNIHIFRKPRFLPEKAIENEVPKELWNRLQKGENIVCNDKTYVPQMVLGSNRKGIKLSFITDTRPLSTIPFFIQECDLFICEGTYGNDSDKDKAISNKHMTFCEAAKLAKEGNVGELLLTHFSTAMDEPLLYIENAKDIFDNVSIAYDGLCKSLTYTD
ncbi:ribonuclease Z [Tissierella sp. Yu-01]|uniref:ribonuclease Z n=1 Tax=Tissierella sp. Yu-01 TaxID=3035694 RepID=UPI00240D8FFA|nr:ribonuclease Z [Tissierella sp. Yu-01]WFA09090.1 ribonuclease Z [Tissierella sp. Yu-01]